MADDPRIRASDDDRDRTATLLREHHAAGRLDPEEFNERLDKVYQAKTLGELDELMSDLPAIDLYRLPDAGLSRQRPRPGPPRPPAPPGGPPRRSSHWRGALGSWFSVSLVLVVIWALSGMGYPWFAWPVGIWGALVIGNVVTGGSHHGRGHQLEGDQRRPGQDELGE